LNLSLDSKPRETQEELISGEKKEDNRKSHKLQASNMQTAAKTLTGSMDESHLLLVSGKGTVLMPIMPHTIAAQAHMNKVAQTGCRKTLK
jgi:hypothetical protein